MPRNETSMAATSISCWLSPRSGRSALAEKAIFGDSPEPRKTAPRMMMRMPGRIVPATAPDELKKAESFISRKFIRVDSQMVTQITATTKSLLPARGG